MKESETEKENYRVYLDLEEIIAHFQRFGPLIVDWPHKQESKSYFPPKGYAFLIFTYERSVQDLIDECVIDDSKLYMCVSSPSMKDKAVQIRPWLLADSDFVMDGTQPLDPRKTIFVGGVPRPLRAGKALALAIWMSHDPLRCSSSWTGDDHGSIVWRRVLCRHRYWSRIEISERSRSSRIFQSTELHRCHFCSFRTTATRRDRQTRTSFLFGIFLVDERRSRWKSNRMFSMINCAMNAQVHDAEASSLRSSVRMWPAFNTIVKRVGHRFIRVPEENITNLWLRKALIVHVRCHFVGKEVSFYSSYRFLLCIFVGLSHSLVNTFAHIDVFFCVFHPGPRAFSLDKCRLDDLVFSLLW